MNTEREQAIIKTSIIGVAANLLLALFKAVVGILANSISVILDAVNNLSDAISSIVTIIGTKLASRMPDKKHPLGHGRIEYLSAMIVAAIVLYAGITSLVESVKKIISPEAADYSTTGLIIIAVAVAVKLLLGSYVRMQGKKYNSDALFASGTDAFLDAVVSLSVLAAALVFIRFGIALEAYVGVVIAILIIKTGIEMLSETLSEIIGRRVDKDFLDPIRKTICEEPEVYGAYDLILHNYGPEKYVGSVHVEIDDTLDALQIDSLERRIADRVFQEHGVIMTGVGIYARNTKDEELRSLQQEVYRRVFDRDGILQIHGFNADKEKRVVKFDIIIDYDLKNRGEIYKQVCDDLSAAFPDWRFHVTMDIDI